MPRTSRCKQAAGTASTWRAFQFGEFVGVGALYGRRNEFQLGARLQHVSNGGIKRPNDGLTYGMLALNYRF